MPRDKKIDYRIYIQDQQLADRMVFKTTTNGSFIDSGRRIHSNGRSCERGGMAAQPAERARVEGIETNAATCRQSRSNEIGYESQHPSANQAHRYQAPPHP